MLGPLLAMLVKAGEANLGIIITVGLIFEALGLGGFWLVVRNDYRTEENENEHEDRPLSNLRSKIFHPKSEESEDTSPQ